MAGRDRYGLSERLSHGIIIFILTYVRFSTHSIIGLLQCSNGHSYFVFFKSIGVPPYTISIQVSLVYTCLKNLRCHTLVEHYIFPYCADYASIMKSCECIFISHFITSRHAIKRDVPLHTLWKRDGTEDGVMVVQFFFLHL